MTILKINFIKPEKVTFEFCIADDAPKVGDFVSFRAPFGMKLPTHYGSEPVSKGEYVDLLVSEITESHIRGVSDSFNVKLLKSLSGFSVEDQHGNIHSLEKVEFKS